MISILISIFPDVAYQATTGASLSEIPADTRAGKDSKTFDGGKINAGFVFDQQSHRDIPKRRAVELYRF